VSNADNRRELEARSTQALASLAAFLADWGKTGQQIA